MTFLPAPVLGSISMLLFTLNLTLAVIPFYFFAIIKLLIPVKSVRHICLRILETIGETWISVNKILVSIFLDIDWDVRGVSELKRKDWYLIGSNHQNWNDVFMLQVALNRRVPFPRFFLKKELIWVPLLGLAWWAMEMPFMKRHSKKQIKANPALRGEDLETTRIACEKLSYYPSAVINFLEGTRFTPEKHDKQKSPYKHLLLPKAGGLAFVLSSLGNKMRNYLDVTIVYPRQDLSFWDFMCGRMRKVIINVQKHILPEWLFDGDYLNDQEFRTRFQTWVNENWAAKDVEFATLYAQLSADLAK